LWKERPRSIAVPSTSEARRMPSFGHAPDRGEEPRADLHDDRDRAHAQLPLVLLGILALLTVATGLAPPAGRLNWFLELAPAFAGIALLAATYRALPLSHLAYGGVFVHALIVFYGAYYTYAATPLGNWAREVFHLSRNHYDRIGHLALGLVPALIVREVLLRRTPLRRGGWLAFLVASVALALGAFWELIEWWVTLVVAPDVGEAFLGTQGDVWDTQWDMFFVLVGALVALATLASAHDRSMARVPRFEPHEGRPR
jgi:putative membrane protein